MVAWSELQFPITKCITKFNSDHAIQSEKGCIFLDQYARSLTRGDLLLKGFYGHTGGTSLLSKGTDGAEFKMACISQCIL